MRVLFQLIDHGNGIIFHRDAAFALFVGDQVVLAQTLRELEKDGLILRKAFPQVPPKVVYSLTRYGRTLEPILLALCAWGEKDFKRRKA